MYSTGLFAFHLFCNIKDIAEQHRALADPMVLTSFIPMLAGTYAGSTVKNFVYGVQAWHIIHGSMWKIDAIHLQTFLTARKKLAPPDTRKGEKVPWSIKYLKRICQGLNQRSPKDAAMLACLTTAFWGIARVGEVTVPDAQGFKASLHVKPADVHFDVQDKNGLVQMEFHLPWTKSAREQGKKIYWAQQNGPSDLKVALTHHLKVNKPPVNRHLFAYKLRKGTRPMTRDSFIARLQKVAKTLGLPLMPRHSIHVGSTLEYLLWGISFKVVKVKGRRKSDAFQLYLRQHAQIMAPYMQANPNAFTDLVRHAMPPVR